MDQKQRYKELKKVSYITIAVNAVLAVFKMIIGLISGSTAVVSDGVHTFSDVFTTVIVLIGLKMASGEADKEHPYGHQRIESIISMFLSFILGLTAFYLGYEGITKLFAGERAEPSVLALFITVLSILSKEWMYRYTKKVAIKLDSSSMLSDAWHHRTDAVSSVAVLIGVAGSFAGIGILDPIAAIAVCFIIFKAVIEIAGMAVNQLIDKSADENTVKEIEDIANNVEGVIQIDLLKTRISNNIIFVEMEIAVDAGISVCQGHQIAEEVHDLIEERILNVGHCMVHVNPIGVKHNLPE